MSTTHAISRSRVSGLIAITIVAVLAAPAAAQNSPSAGPEVVAFAGGIDVVSAYMFRGVRQNSTGLAIWPFGDIAVRAYSSDGPLKRVAFNVGFWNSLNTGDTGSDGPSRNLWYESRVYAALGLRFGRGVSVATSYTTYTSPNDLFTTAKEIGVRLSVDDNLTFAGTAVHPYALVAFEVDADPGVGQLDGGSRGGKYFEVGATPSFTATRAGVSFPVKVGLSLDDYYELADHDNRFGFVSVASILTVPLGRKSGAGQLSLHGGVEFQALGETTKVFNGGDRSKVSAVLGVGLAR